MKKRNWRKRLLAAALCAGLVLQSLSVDASEADLETDNTRPEWGGN